MIWPRIAILDSGLAAGHPHLAGADIAGFSLVGDEPPLQRAADFSDVTGHGTAATAALLRLVPGVSVLAVRLLDSDLRTTSLVLAEGIRIAADEGARVLNLSLGSQRPEARELLDDAVAHATSLGAICVASAHPRGTELWPADLPTVISAATDRGCPLADLYRTPGPLPRFLAHGFPRPIEGRAPTDNFFGTSFAAVHVSARVLRALAEQPEAGFSDIVGALDAQCVGTWEAS